jgi:ABC-2 type transport system permease protein
VSVVAREKTGSLRAAWNTVVAFVRLDVVDDLSYPLSLVFRLVSPIVTVVLYFFQSRFLGRPDAFTATLIGISVAVAMQSALGGFGMRLQQVQERGTLETILVEPVPWLITPLTMNLWLSTFGISTMALMLVLGGLMGADLVLAGVPAFVAVLGLALLACQAIGLLAASVLVISKKSGPVMALYGMAASLLGGMLFSIDVLPGWLRPFSFLVPHSYAISASRDLLMAEPFGTGMPLGTAILGLLLFNLVMYPLASWAFGRSLQYARRMGLLSGY